MSGWRRCARPGVALATLALVLATLLAGCGLTQTKRLPEPQDMAKDQTLKMILPAQDGYGLGTLTSLDPAALYPQDVYGAAIQPATLLFDGLVTLDRNEHVEPWGASFWTISPDGLTYTFTLRPNQRFSDGAPVKASDYAWSFDRLANPCLVIDDYDVNIAYSFLVALKDAEAFHGKAFHGEGCVDGQPTRGRTTLIGDSILPDDSAGTLTFILSQPTGFFLNALATPLTSVLERSVVGPGLGGDETWTQHLADGVTGQGGSGMFYLARMVRGANNSLTELVFKPNPHWWGIQAGKRPNFTEIDLLGINVSAALDAFKNDPSIAYGGTINPQALVSSAPELKRQPYYHEQPTLSTTSLVFNETKAPFDDINVRKALCLAINREQFESNHLLYRGTSPSGYHSVGAVPPDYPSLYQGSLIPSWHLVASGMDGYNAQLDGLDSAPVTGNAALAKHYWQRYLAAHNNQPPQLGMVARGDGNIERALSYNWLQALGVPVQLVAPAFPAAESVQSSDPWAIEDATINFADPAEAFLSGLTGSASFDYIPLKTDAPEADALLQRADALTNMSQRIPLYQRAEQMLIDNAAVCPLFQHMDHYALRPWVKGGFIEDVRGIFPNDAWVTGYIAKH